VTYIDRNQARFERQLPINIARLILSLLILYRIFFSNSDRLNNLVSLINVVFNGQISDVIVTAIIVVESCIAYVTNDLLINLTTFRHADVAGPV
jgi:hypothetical protein